MERQHRLAVTLTPSMEDYLRAVYEEERAGGPASTTALAERLAVAPASATGMMKKLHRLGLVSRAPYSGVVLTGAGRKVALETIRHHRLIETYLSEALGVPWDEVHAEAHRLEHHISEGLEDRMAEALGHPDRDPHGAAIPPKSGPFTEPAYQTLADIPAGSRVVIREVEDEDPERLRYLEALGLLPDVAVYVVAVEPFNGPLSLRVSENDENPGTVVVGRELAGTIKVA